MPRTEDLKPGEELVRKRISLTRETYDLVMQDAHTHTENNLSRWLRILIRKHYGIEELRS